MERFSELKNKEVIDERECKRLGYVCDLEIDLECGAIVAIIVPLSSGFMGVFGKCDELVIPWKDIERIGEDIILVNVRTRHHHHEEE